MQHDDWDCLNKYNVGAEDDQLSIKGVAPACLGAQTNGLWVPSFIHLYVRLREGDHLGQDLLAVEICHLVPLPASLVQHMHLVRASFWLSIMDNVGHQVVGGSIFVLCLHLFRQQISKFNAFDWKVDNGGVLLHKEGVLGEPLEEVVLVGLVLLLFNPIELRQYVV